MQTSAINYFNMLSEYDQMIYTEIRNAISAPTNKDKRKQCIDDFQDILQAIELFENREETERWKRCLVCGIFRYDGGLAVNISQLKCLIFKCKSSINGWLKKMGYGVIVSKISGTEPIFETIPFLRDHPSELKRWTLRLYREPKENTLKEGIPKENIAKKCESNIDYMHVTEPETNNFQSANVEISAPAINDDTFSTWNSEQVIDENFCFDDFFFSS